MSYLSIFSFPKKYYTTQFTELRRILRIFKINYQYKP